MLRHSLVLLIFCASLSCSPQGDKLSSEDRQQLGASLKELGQKYDPDQKMVTRKLSGWNYHTDAVKGTFHEVRASLSYAVMLLDYGGAENQRRAFDIIDKVISLQDTVSSSRTRGIWPYYEEEPLATKKSPADFNWADFNGVSLLDVWLDHENEIPAALKPKIRRSLELAARSIEKRDVGPGYTNIAIMGTYVTYMTSKLFNLSNMHQYAIKRLQHFYDYTLERGGFTEYNSPTYTMVALDELNRMQRHFEDPAAVAMVDSLYAIGWTMIARHYHKPSGQWAGPHSRAYSPLVGKGFYSVLYQGSNGQIDLGETKRTGDVKIRHHIPSYLLHYFMTPAYPRTETDEFVTDSPQIVGTAYLSSDYALATANRSSMWNQRHPMTAYWGSLPKPHYLQVRLLHDFYDFSSADFYSMQRKNRVLAAISFATGGGDKHISIDKIKDGRFQAEDLRLRFEFGNHTTIDQLHLPVDIRDPFTFIVENMPFYLHLYQYGFAGYQGHWETGRDDDVAWVDLVLYSGERKEFDLTKLDKTALGFTFAMGDTTAAKAAAAPLVRYSKDEMDVRWDSLEVKAMTKPVSQPRNL